MNQPYRVLSKAAYCSSIILAVMLSGLSGCSDKSSDTQTKSANIDPNVLAEKQEIVINNGTEPESLDPHKISGLPEANIIRQQLVGLVTTDKQGKTIPAMAESWDSPDNKVWTFHLRDAKWSNGDPVTANDFVYSMRRVLDPKTASPYGSYLIDAKVVGAQAVLDGRSSPETLGVKALDDKTLEVRLTEPVPYFADMLIHASTYPVHAKTVEKYGEKWTDPENIVVNGPYKISRWLVNDKIIMTRNPAYYDDAHTTINTITFLPIESETTNVARYKAGEIDIGGGMPTEQFDSLKSELGDEVQVSPSLCSFYYLFNNKKPPFDDVRVRRALAIALDRDTITQKVMGQGQTPAYQFTPTSINGMTPFTPEWQKWDKARRNEEAKKLLNEAGYSASHPLKFELLYNTNEGNKKLAVATNSLLKESISFIDVSLINKEWKTFLDTARNGNYQMARYTWCGDYNEPSTFLNIVKTGNSNNWGGYSSAKFDSLMNQTLKEGVTPEQRAELYRQAEAQLDADMPQLNVFHIVKISMVKPYVVNFPIKDPLSNWQIKDVSIAKH
ncbi:MAG TPA: oligopeptide ABC transporter substrate-binding protein OppA [Psychrobacter sp.]|nr:oligopeptide ABC transporter substrate-binding protein OppA [Psychrobacter sp.]